MEENQALASCSVFKDITSCFVKKKLQRIQKGLMVDFKHGVGCFSIKLESLSFFFPHQRRGKPFHLLLHHSKLFTNETDTKDKRRMTSPSADGSYFFNTHIHTRTHTDNRKCTSHNVRSNISLNTIQMKLIPI